MTDKYVMVIKNYFDNSEHEVYTGELHQLKELQYLLDIPSHLVFITTYEDYYGKDE